MNTVILTGNITRDFEMRYIPESQTAVAQTTLAVKRPFGKDKTDFIPIVAFAKTAENCEKYTHKGSKILVEGTLVIDQYEKDGEKKTFAKVNCNRVEFLSPRSEGGAQENSDADFKQTPGIPEGFQALEDDDDIPF